MILNHLFYFLKPSVPRSIQIILRRQIALSKLRKYSHLWPIDPASSKPPPGWKGWPENKRFALVLTHDVDTAGGQEKCKKLMELEKSLGFKSSFNFIPERYKVSAAHPNYLGEKGFEVGVHGLNHDGKLFRSKKIFQRRAQKINQYLKEWNAVGFRSPSMHHKLNWLHGLNIEYDLSTFDTDLFEPQSDGVRTIFPFRVNSDAAKKGYIELPYTIPQDFTLFILIKERSIDIWKQKVDWIVEQQGMALINTHPDYMNFDGAKPALEEYPVQYYEQFLQYIKTKYKGKYWHILPKGMSRFWSTNMMNSRE